MTDSAILNSDLDARLLGEAMEALGRRDALPGGAAREDLDRRLVIALEHLKRPLAPAPERLLEPPPRPIAVAIALTLFSQPHLVATFGRPGTHSADRPVARPALVASELLSEMLGLARWELDELQAEVDRRVSLQLKQHRVLSWLWSHFGLPKQGVASLIEVLLPGLRDTSAATVGLSRRGAQLYAIVDQARGPRADSLYLSWLDRSISGAIPPRGTFAARYVDANLLRQVCRGVGAEPAEVMALLDRAVTVIPRQRAADFLALDRWRALSYESLTGIAGSYPRGSELVDPLEPHQIAVDGWLRRDGDTVRIDNGKALFDSLALERAGEVAQQLHAHTVASFLTIDAHDAQGHDLRELVRYDVVRHLKRVLRPLIAWTEDPRTAEHLGSRLGVDRPAAQRALDELCSLWSDRLNTTWTGLIHPQRPASVAARLTAQVLRTRQALGLLWTQHPELGQEHREAALLFSAHYLAEAPLDRLWSREREALAEDPVGQWFWPLWVNLLYAREDEPSSDSTYSF